MLSVAKYSIVELGKTQQTGLFNKGINRIRLMKKLKQTSPDVLYAEYDWFNKLFPLAMQKSSDGFFLPGLRCEMIGVSKNINLLQTNKPHFVTKVRIDKFYDMFLRIEEPTVSLLLERGLGKSNRGFNINKLTDLEGEVLTQFNDYVYKIIVQFLEPPPVVNFTRTNFDVTHITFVIKDEEEGSMGRFIISVPDGRLKPNKVVSKEDKFEYSDFYKCTVPVKISLGHTRLSVKSLKELEPDDLIILEYSRLNRWKLYLNDFEKDLLLEPNESLVIPFDDDNGDGGNDMADINEANNLWDSIEVDMYAEFNPVKISLGDLKKIEEGLVVDVAAIYDNKVTLRVENKVVGHGELVIVNDRYGVKILDIAQRGEEETSEEETFAAAQNGPVPPTMDFGDEEGGGGQNEEAPQQAPTGGEGGDDEEFDYSDFELEDEDI